ncbi:hypothetical protein GPAL_1043 [Glaciecola pallidula DSM 14239 = ACAM 615]|uniref:Uncharacterized protein n=1 Tax=Brumicola pallidula DSM 14239 = ACAM 615 TaxID=1121922 RepID=K6ZC46_9ALTE|nr:hypothetical protein GPAL_1043 [Glaciecola pallidula DSM 14239 = ACAM 615]
MAAFLRFSRPLENKNKLTAYESMVKPTTTEKVRARKHRKTPQNVNTPTQITYKVSIIPPELGGEKK